MLRAASQDALYGQGHTHSMWVNNQERHRREHKVDTYALRDLVELYNPANHEGLSAYKNVDNKL